MSKRRRKYTAKRRPGNNGTAIITKPQEAVARSKPIMAMDAYYNQLAFLGEASELVQANGFERNSITQNTELLTVMYRENWIAKRIIDTPCEDMTRAWYSISSSIDQTKLDEITELEAKHNIKQEITNGLRWARLYGGAAAIMVIKGQEDMLDEPLDYDALMPGCFRGLLIVDRSEGLIPSVELEEDMDDPEYNYPKYYDVTINNESNDIVRVHHSRMLIFRGRMLPLMEERTESYWGASELEHIYDELQKRNSTSANIAQMVFQANITALKMQDYGEVIGMGTEEQKARIYQTLFEQNRIKNSFGTLIMSADDQYESHPNNFAGLKEIYELFMMDMAGAAEIPATKLYGRSPQGMNATGESDMKNYYEMITQLQERHLRPAMDKLLPVMCMSLWGEIPEDMQIVFSPVATTTPTERATIISQYSGTIIQAFTSGLISQKRALMELVATGKEVGAWSSITQDFIDKADDEADSGEMGGMDPMAAMMGGGGEEMPQDMLEEPQDEPEQPSEPEDEETPIQEENAPEGASEALEQIIAEETESDEPENEEENANDGGPGSGPKPGYKKKNAKGNSLLDRVKFMSNPTEGIPEPKRSNSGPTGSKAQVAKNNKERKEWGDLSLHQKVKGNSEQQKHMNKVKAEAMKSVLKGDMDKAREIVRENRQYFSNDPDSAMKVQSETLKRQKAVKT